MHIEHIEKLQPCAHWEPDCNGKTSYDGPIVSIESRYWPGHYDKHGQHTASASIVVHTWHEPTNQADHFDLVIATDLNGSTELAVRAKVEDWVTQKMQRIVQILADAELEGKL